jgi:hypothetical protein
MMLASGIKDKSFELFSVFKNLTAISLIKIDYPKMEDLGAKITNSLSATPIDENDPELANDLKCLDKLLPPAEKFIRQKVDEFNIANPEDDDEKLIMASTLVMGMASNPEQAEAIQKALQKMPGN